MIIEQQKAVRTFAVDIAAKFAKDPAELFVLTDHIIEYVTTGRWPFNAPTPLYGDNKDQQKLAAMLDAMPIEGFFKA